MREEEKAPMKTILPYLHFLFNYEFQQSLYFKIFFHSVHFNFINLKPEKNSCKMPAYLDLHLRVSLQLHSSQFQAPLNPKNKRNQLLLSERNSKQRQTRCWSENQNKFCPMNQWFTFMLSKVELFPAVYFTGATCIASPDQSIIKGKI